MTATQILTIAAKRGVELRAVGDKLVFKAPRGVMDEKIKSLLRAHKPELIAILGKNQPAVDYGHCKSRDCRYFLDHKANPRCLHPLCTQGGKHSAGLCLHMLVECPVDTNRLRWYVPKVSHDHGGTLPEHIHAGGGQTEKDEDSGIFYGINAVFL